MELPKQSRIKKIVLIALPTLGMLIGAYILIVALAPVIPPSLYVSQEEAVARLAESRPELDENRLHIPQIDLSVPIVPINGNEEYALNLGAIHRAETSGNPRDGGNYVVAGHRFNYGLTPQETRRLSPFYHIDKLSLGDEIFVDYEGERYVYRISEKRGVPATAVEIEQPTDQPRLTLYSCELGGSLAGREVIFAKPVGTVEWLPDGTTRVVPR